MTSPYITAKAAAGILGCSYRTALRLTPAILPAIPIDGLTDRGGRGTVVTVFERADVDALHDRYGKHLPTIPKILRDLADPPP